jgi:hypothetical protein
LLPSTSFQESEKICWLFSRNSLPRLGILPQKFAQASRTDDSNPLSVQWLGPCGNTEWIYSPHWGGHADPRENGSSNLLSADILIPWRANMETAAMIDGLNARLEETNRELVRENAKVNGLEEKNRELVREIERLQEQGQRKKRKKRKH